MKKDNFTRYVVLLKNVPDKIPSEALIREHVNYLKKIDKEGKLELCGPFTDYKGGLVILKSLTREEAQLTAQLDPFINKGFKTFEIRTLELSCEENNHLGMG